MIIEAVRGISNWVKEPEVNQRLYRKLRKETGLKHPLIGQGSVATEQAIWIHKARVLGKAALLTGAGGYVVFGGAQAARYSLGY